MEIQFSGKRALVTGAGQGIGRALVKHLSTHGATVFALSKSEDNLKSLAQEVTGIQTIAVDLSDWEATRKAVDSIGHVDLLVNNAGIAILESFMTITPDSFDKLIAVNVKAVINVSQVVAGKMILNKTGGSIVNISSQASMCALRDHAVYCGTKAALDSISKVMALELGQHKVYIWLLQLICNKNSFFCLFYIYYLIRFVSIV